jgi:hypothetical protein
VYLVDVLGEQLSSILVPAAWTVAQRSPPFVVADMHHLRVGDPDHFIQNIEQELIASSAAALCAVFEDPLTIDATGRPSRARVNSAAGTRRPRSSRRSQGFRIRDLEPE